MKKIFALSIAALIAGSVAASAGETHKKKVHSGQAPGTTTGQASTDKTARDTNSSTSPTTANHSDLSGTTNNPTQQSLQSR